MHPTYPRILPDRDKTNDFYLDEDVFIRLHNQNTIILRKGFKFDSHSVPLIFRLFTPRYLPTKNNEQNDIYAAMVHDSLIAFEHYLPYNRTFVDFEYERIMYHPCYLMNSWRSTVMPFAVSLWGKIRYWNDYRGKIIDGDVVYDLVGVLKY